MVGLLAGVLGAIIGSYIGAVAIRWPRQQQTVTGRSICDNCNRRLSWFELVPLFSYIALAGKCRSCRASIAMEQPISEWFAALFCAFAFLSFPPMEAMAWCVFALLLLPLALLDARYYWLPLRLVGLLAIAGVLIGHLTSLEQDILSRLVAAVIVLTVLEVTRLVYQRVKGEEGMGSADPKLLAAIALWLNPFVIPYILMGSALMGIVDAILRKLSNKSNRKLPLGTYFATAALIVGVATAHPAFG